MLSLSLPVTLVQKQGGGSYDKLSYWPTDQNSQTVNTPDKLPEADDRMFTGQEA